MEETKTHTKKRSLLAKIGRGFGIFILSVLALIVLLLIAIQTAPVQNFARKKIVAFLENKLKTRVEIKRLDIDFPKMLVLRGVYIEDKTKDTLVAGNELKVDIDMFKLLHKEIQINEINLNQITAKIKRQLPDTIFNYQFIVDAFASPKDTTVKDTSAMKMAIEKIIVDKTRLVYFDVVTGNDVDVYLNHFDTRIDTFDPANLRYDVPSITLNGFKGRVHQSQPMAVTAVVANPDSTVSNEPPKFLNFTNKEILLKDIDLNYTNDVSAMTTKVSFKDLNIHPQSFDLKNSVIAIKDVELNNLKGFLRSGKQATAKVVKLTDENAKEVPAEAMPWKFTIASVKFNDNNFQYDDDSKPRLSKGMDYAHLDIKDLTLHADNFLFHNDTIATNITEGQMTERSGFVLNKFQANVIYTDKGASLHDILIQTPGSEIKRSAVIRYPSLAAIQKEMGLLEMDINIDNSYLQVKDILTFMPTLSAQPAFRNPEAKLYVNTILRGSLARLVIDRFQLRGLRNTNVDVSGTVNNAMDAKNVSADLSIRRFNTSRDDIMSLAPKGSIPQNISLPETMALNGKIKGGMKRLEITQFQFTDSRNTNIDISGIINNATDTKNANADINIKRFNTSRGEIVALTPAGTIPKNITIPNTMSLTGKIKGGMKSAFANLTLNTSLGSAKVDGKISNALDSINAVYNATISTSNLNLGAIMQQPQNMGALSASFTIDGRGYDPEKANASLKGIISSAEIKQYTYKNLNLEASIADQKFTANANMDDPNIHFAIQAQGDMSGNLPGFVVNADIDSLKTLPLHLTPNAIVYHGKITANVPELNLDALNGELHVVNSVLVMNGQRIAMDSVSVVASHVNDEQIIALKTDFVNAVIRGQYKLQQLGDIMMEAIQPYYAISPPAPKQVNIDPYNFTINANVVDHPTIHQFVPNLQRFDGITIKSNFSSSDGWNANVSVPYILYGTNIIDNLKMNAATANNALNVTTSVNQIAAGTSIILYKPAIAANISNNTVDFGISLKDKASKTKYRFGGLFAQEPDSIFTFSLKPDSLMLNYDTWSINRDNLIRFGSTIVNAKNFNLNKGEQHLIINSINSSANSPLEVDVRKFDLATLSAFVQSDSLPIEGMLNGNVMVKDVLTQPNFTTDLTLNNLALKRDTIGDVNIKVNNNTENVFATNVTITGRGNDVNLTGNYYLKPANNSNFDFNLNINRLPFKTVEAASMGAITQATGNLTGKVAINGTVTSPNVDGGISFNKTGFNVAMLGSYFRIDGETIKVNSKGIKFDTFTIKDSANNSLVLDGLAGTNNFINYNLDLTLKARNFRAINTTKRQNALYYGQLYFNTNMRIKGTETAPVVDGNLRINENTNLSIVLPQPEPGVVDRKGVIEFVDMDAPGSDTIFKRTLAKYDSSFNTTAVTGMDVSINLEIQKEATFNIIVDEGNGDFLQVKGAAQLTAGIDPSGKTTMAGTYEIESGAYDLSFNFIHRRFDIQKGSKITWTGEPTTADIDITAVYVANTSAMDLVQNQINDNTRNYYQQKLPFQVKLMMKGQLMQPELTFDIALPTENNVRVSNEVLTTVNTRLDQVRTEPSELNKQVFALLLLNRFVSENPFESSGGGGGFSAGSFARQSVSKILTEQLNKLAGDLIAGVDISFDVNSADDYTTGERRDRTDFNVNLSKRLLNDRLKVTVGSNYELEGPQQSKQTASNVIGNVTIDYNLTQDGRLLLRGYRKNDYEAVVEGYVIETGLKFIISVDYNKFKDIFRKRRRFQQQKETKSQATQATTSNTPAENDQVISDSEKTVADDRKSIPASVKDSTDGN
ncbi:translocation/assembly module TamB domain-containing protein [Segetibacter koreensis]|uniref:translocation/assembly module TamB domain-containing protein n=1 Tax=Segetibacter koreensis TaxID=398037 RepID=UPI00037871C4|nr:translocation/assembly module TamB domain-containing protein [Segetibacter koreensis]